MELNLKWTQCLCFCCHQMILSSSRKWRAFSAMNYLQASLNGALDTKRRTLLCQSQVNSTLPLSFTPRRPRVTPRGDKSKYGFVWPLVATRRKQKKRKRWIFVWDPFQGDYKSNLSLSVATCTRLAFHWRGSLRVQMRSQDVRFVPNEKSHSHWSRDLIIWF